MALIRRAATEGWNVPPDAKQEAVQLCRDTIAGRTPASKAQLAAVRCLIAADQVDARREATAAADNRAESSIAASILRQALSSPDSAAALQTLTNTLPTTTSDSITPDESTPTDS